MSRSLNKYRRYVTGNIKIDRNLQDIETVLETLASNPLLHGVIVKDVDLQSSSARPVNHGLGREVVGWIVIKQNASGSVYDSPAPTGGATNNALWLKATSTMTASIYVF